MLWLCGSSLKIQVQIVKYFKGDTYKRVRLYYLLSVVQFSFTRKAKMIVPKVKFNNGLEIPIFGLGTWKVPGLYFSLSLLFTYFCVYSVLVQTRRSNSSCERCHRYWLPSL